MENFSFESLEAYKQSRRLVVEVYKIINIFPQYERFGLSSQLGRAIVSVVSNICEGSGRISLKEKIHFIEISFGSLMEAYSQLQICCDLNYISENTLKQLKPDFFRVSRLLNGLRNSFINQLSE